MTPHTHGLHAASPTMSLRLALLSDDPPAKRLKSAAETLNTQLKEGDFNRMNETRKTELFALVWMMDSIADQLAHAAEPAPPPVARSWWRFWG